MAGNANLAEQGVDTNLVNAIADLQRQLRELKTTVQPIDARTLQASRFPTSGPITLGPFSLNARGCKTVACDITLPSNIGTLINCEFSLYVNGYGPTYLWPYGADARVGSAAINIIGSAFVDYATYASTPNTKRVLCSAYSADSVSHTVYFEVSFIVPTAATAVTASNTT